MKRFCTILRGVFFVLFFGCFSLVFPATFESTFAPPLQLSLTAKKAPLAGHMALWLDSSENATLEQARTQTFVPVAGNINLGYQPDVLWVRMLVQRGTERHDQTNDQRWWLEIAPSLLDDITLWVEAPTNTAQGNRVVVQPAQQAGAAMHPGARPLWHRHSVFLLNLPDAGVYTLWLRVKTDNAAAVRPVLWQISALEQQTQIDTVFAGLFYGAFICIVLIALVLGVAVGLPIFMFCIGFFFLLGLNLFIADGWFGLFLFPAQPKFADALSSSCMALLIPLIGSIFLRLLLAHQYRWGPWVWYQRIAWLAALMAVLFLLSGHFAQVAPIVNMAAMAQLALITALALWVIPREPSLSWVMFTLIPLFIPGLLRLAHNAGLDISIYGVDISLFVGIFFSAVLLLFFIARRFGQSYRLNLQARAEVIAGAAQLNEQRDFVALLQHEFRNPIFVIESALNNLARQPLDAPTCVRLGRIGRAAERLKYVLAFCLADERMATLALAPRLRSILSAADIVIESMQQLDDQSQRLQLLPTGANNQAELDAARVLGDLPMLGAALKNLLDNALKYAGNSLVQLSVHLQDGKITFIVRDHGPGFDEQASSYLFEKFSRGAQHPNIPGAGLGLHLSRKIVQQHGGEICVRNLSGGGAVSELCLPLSKFEH